MSSLADLDIAELLAAVELRDGRLHWRHREDVHVEVNSLHAGKPIKLRKCTQGYRRLAIRIHGNLFWLAAHRVVWLLTHGDWPSGQIDHVNGDRADNRIENLRDVTPAVNRMNMACRRDSKTGVAGVYWNTAQKRWRARISAEGKVKYLGSFHTFEEAAAARLRAQRELGYTERHGVLTSPHGKHSIAAFIPVEPRHNGSSRIANRDFVPFHPSSNSPRSH